MDLPSDAFGPTNGPATFINFIHDINSQLKALAAKSGLVIDNDTNTKIIVDDIFSWGKNLDKELLYIERQLRVCLSYRLLLSLCKSHIFPKRFEFVGIDVCLDGNRPAISKHQLLEHWPQPEIIHDVAKIVGFVQFYRLVWAKKVSLAAICLVAGSASFGIRIN